jgi:hypothetical protein
MISHGDGLDDDDGHCEDGCGSDDLHDDGDCHCDGGDGHGEGVVSAIRGRVMKPCYVEEVEMITF